MPRMILQRRGQKKVVNPTTEPSVPLNDSPPTITQETSVAPVEETSVAPVEETSEPPVDDSPATATTETSTPPVADSPPKAATGTSLLSPVDSSPSTPKKYTASPISTTSNLVGASETRKPTLPVTIASLPLHCSGLFASNKEGEATNLAPSSPYYQFSTASEFKVISESQNKKSRIAYEDIFLNKISPRPCIELPLTVVENWTKDFKFKKCLSELKEKNMIWTFKLIVIDPSIMASMASIARTTKQQEKEWSDNKEKMDWFIAKAKAFYRAIFQSKHAQVQDQKSIDHCCEKDVSILIMGCHNNARQGSARSLWKKTSSFVVSAITFCKSYPPHDSSNNGIPAFIYWIAVVTDVMQPQRPQCLSKWHRQGFASFMILCAIKRCVCDHNPDTTLQTIQGEVALYLQCTGNHLLPFYKSCGFQIMLDNETDDGFHLLPPILQESLLPSRELCYLNFPETPASKMKGEDEVQSPPAAMLLCLSAGAFNPVKENIPSDASTPLTIILNEDKDKPSDKGTTMKKWCEFPFPIDVGFTEVDLLAALSNLPLVNGLLPSPGSSLEENSMAIKGYQWVDDRMLHYKEEEKKWWQTNELELMLSIIFRDGRYDDSVAIIPPIYNEAIEDAAKKFVRLMDLHTFEYELKQTGAPDSIIKARIIQEFGAASEIIKSEYETAYNLVCRSVILRKEFLHKKVIIFIHNIGHSHWRCTFVFNASEIAATDNDSLRACFFRYDPQFPSGEHLIKSNCGMIWFLNTIYSLDHWNQLRLQGHENPEYTILQPFGSHTAKYVFGSESFPAILRVFEPYDPIKNPLKHDREPFQHDGFNCGTGVFAIIAHLLRDVIVGEDESTFENYFRRSAMQIVPRKTHLQTEEKVVFLPKDALKLAPTKADFSLGGRDYLDELRRQFLVLFDRLADYKHKTLRMRKNPNFKVVDWYQKFYFKVVVNGFPITEKKKEKDKLETKPAGETTEKGNLETKPAGVETLEKVDLDSKPAQSDEASVDSLEELLKQVSATKTVKPYSLDHDSLSDNSSGSSSPPASKGKKLQKKKKVVADGSDLSPKPKKKSKPKENKKKSPSKKRKSNTAEDPTPTKKTKVGVDEEAYWKKLRDQAAEALIRQRENEINEPNPQLDGRVLGDPDDESWDKLLEDAMVEIEVQATVSEDFKTAISAVKDPMSNADVAKLRDEKDGIYQKEIGLFKQNEMNKFVDKSLEEWGWWTEKEFKQSMSEYQTQLDDARKIKNATTRTNLVNFYQRLIRSMKVERNRMKSFLEKEFRATRPGFIKGLRYDKARKEFTARLVYKEKEGNEMIEKEETMKMDLEWVKSVFEEGAIAYVMNMAFTEQFCDVPKSEVAVDNEAIVKVRYVCEYTKSIVDAELFEKQIKEEDAQISEIVKMREDVLRSGLVRDNIPRKKGKKYSPPERVDPSTITSVEGEFKRKPPPKKQITIPAKWIALHASGRKSILEETEVCSMFGEAYAEDLKKIKSGFLEIPVGDCKESILHLYPNLQDENAPLIKYQQSMDQDLCLSNALASVLYRCQMTKCAEDMRKFGEAQLLGGSINTLENVKSYAAEVLPRWIKCKCIKGGFDWKTDLEQGDILLAVLLANDGHNSHGVAIHNGFIYDANESKAIPLCQEGLDLCCSTESKKCVFVRFWRGYVFHYKGSRACKMRWLNPE